MHIYPMPRFANSRAATAPHRYSAISLVILTENICRTLGFPPRKYRHRKIIYKQEPVINEIYCMSHGRAQSLHLIVYISDWGSQAVVRLEAGDSRGNWAKQIKKRNRRIHSRGENECNRDATTDTGRI
ncbi:hypothetical protein BDZ91DRAFT_741220 [Kalaharituber pfeilii]|nr:hypothetical protein BDZ91DRAFT_741220 [Kalaharituber pfeilii]